MARKKKDEELEEGQSKVKQSEAEESEEPTADDAEEQLEWRNRAPDEGGDDEAAHEGVGEEGMELPDEGERDTGLPPAPKGYKSSDSNEPASPSANQPKAQTSYTDPDLDPRAKEAREEALQSGDTGPDSVRSSRKSKKGEPNSAESKEVTKQKKEDPTVMEPEFSKEDMKAAIIKQQRTGTAEGRTIEEDRNTPGYRDG